MPATREAIAVTDAARAEFLRHRTQLLAAAVRAWQVVPEDDFDGGFDRWLRLIVPFAQASNRQVIEAQNRYLSAFIAAETLATEPVQVETADPDTGEETHTGAPWERALIPAVIAAKIAVRQGQHPYVALRTGARVAVNVLSTEITYAQDQASSTLFRSNGDIVGWRRVPSGSACGGCLAACTGAIQRTDALIPRHGHCRCHKEPVMRTVRERYMRPTGADIFGRMPAAQQDALFAGRGGREKADLIRSGEVPFDALATTSTRGSLGEVVAETPLSQLQARAAR